MRCSEQTPSTPTADLTNKSAEPLKARVSPTVIGISYSYSGAFCGSGSGSNGTYTGAFEVQGVVAVGNAWLSVKRVGGTATEGANGVCEFTAAGQTCQVKFKNVTARTLRVLNVRLAGVNANVRYQKLAEGCVFNLGMGECTDELEAANFQAGGINDYCMTVEDKGNGALHRTCGVLHM